MPIIPPCMYSYYSQTPILNAQNYASISGNGLVTAGCSLNHAYKDGVSFISIGDH